MRLDSNRRHAAPRTGPATLRRLVPLAAIPALAVCGGTPPPPLVLTATELESPAGPDSGEPFVSATDTGVLVSWIGRSPDGVRDVEFAAYDGTGWSEPRVVVVDERLLVNVSDFPSVVQEPGGALWAHWLERGRRCSATTSDWRARRTMGSPGHRRGPLTRTPRPPSTASSR